MPAVEPTEADRLALRRMALVSTLAARGDATVGVLARATGLGLRDARRLLADVTEALPELYEDQSGVLGLNDPRRITRGLLRAALALGLTVDYDGSTYHDQEGGGW